jgi:FixJ family two-component response regulator
MSSAAGPVIVVDDDAAVRDSLRFALQQEGMEVRVYSTSSQLLAERDMPESGCLVIDYYMPGMNGVDLVHSLRGRHVLLPVILITAKATGQMRRDALRAGIGRVLEKPLEDSALVDTIRRALSIGLEPVELSCAWPAVDGSARRRRDS